MHHDLLLLIDVGVPIFSKLSFKADTEFSLLLSFIGTTVANLLNVSVTVKPYLGWVFLTGIFNSGSFSVSDAQAL